MTDDTTVVVPQKKAIEAKINKWAHQRCIAYLSFAACCAWIPLVISWPELIELSWAWFTLQGSVIITWLGGSTFSAMKR